MRVILGKLEKRRFVKEPAQDRFEQCRTPFPFRERRVIVGENLIDGKHGYPFSGLCTKAMRLMKADEEPSARPLVSIAMAIPVTGGTVSLSNQR